MWSETLTSAERMDALMRGERPDRVPVTPMVFGHTAIVCGVPLARVYDDAEESFRCQVLAAEMYGYDGGPLYAYASAGAWEFGGEIEFPVKKYSGAPVVTKTPVESKEDVLSLEAPMDVAQAGAIPIALAFARLQSAHGMPVTMHAGGPFSMAGSILGEDRMMMWMLKQPELVHRVLDKVCDFLGDLAEYYVKEFGAENIMAFGGEPTASNVLISPKQFEVFVLPYVQRVQQHLIDLGVVSGVLHLCGEQNKNLPHWQKVPMTKTTILSFGREVSLAAAMERFPEQIIAGNVDPTLIQEGTPEEVLQQSRECIEVAKYHPGGFILMAGCDVPPQAPPVNVFQLVKAAREYGRY